MTGDKKKSGGGIARLSSDIPRGGDTSWRDQTEGKPTTKPEKKAAAQHPKPTMRIYIIPGTYKPIPETPKQKKNKYKKKQKKKTGGTPHNPHTKKKRRGEKHMKPEETDTLVHFYEDQDGKLYMRLPGGNIRRVKKEKEESLRKSLKKIGYQPTPIQTHKNSWRGSK